MPTELHHFVKGARVAGASGRFGEVYDPATGQVTSRVPFASKAEAEGAIGAAAEAFAGWSATPPLSRARVLFRFKELLERRRSLFGDMHIHRPEGVRFYTRRKTTTSRWPTGVRGGEEFVMPTMK